MVDEFLSGGPVHVITHNRPRYVIMDGEQCRELLEVQEEAYVARIKAAREDVAAGRTRRFEHVTDLLAAIERADDRDDRDA